MKLHQTKFNEIKNLLKKHLGEEVISYEEYGTEYIEIKNNKFWLTIDENEFTVGYGLNHTHFSEEYGNLFDGIIQAFDLITQKVITTDYIKGDTTFKTITDIEFPNLERINIGETSIIIFPFWKKTKIVNSISYPIIDKKDIENEVNKIIN